MSPEEALAELGDFRGGAKLLHRLNDSPISQCYLIEKEQQRYVLRIDTPVVTALGLNRHNEVEVLRAVSGKHLGPEVIVALPEQGILVTSYIEGRNLAVSELQSVERLTAVAALLKRVHAVPAVGCLLDLRARIDVYAANLTDPAVIRIVNEANALLDEVSAGHSTKTLCHHDPIAANLVLTVNQQLRLIDWEYAAIGDPFFDLAVVTRHHDLPPPMIEILLGSYLGTVSDDDRHHLDCYRGIVDRVSHLWQQAVGVASCRES